MNAYIVKGYRSAVGKANKGVFRNYRPDELAAQVIKHLVQSMPQLDKDLIDDVMVGNAMPEADQGLNMGRLISLMALETDKVPGITINRYCASGLETIAMATAKIHAGMAHCIIAGGVESMSLIPMGGWRVTPHPKVAKAHPDWYMGMGLTAEAVANEFNISRADQDEFSFQSNQKALQALADGKFRDEIVPIEVEEVFLNEKEQRTTKMVLAHQDEGPRAETSVEALAQLKPVFAASGSVTAGNSSQTSDGAAFLMVVSEQFMRDHQLEPIARLVSHALVGVPPRIMGIGPVEAIPKALKLAGLSLNDIGLIELNEAFAAQSLAVIRALDLPVEKINVNGGAIALGHPLGCSGAKLTVQILQELKRRNQKYGMVTMCVGTGQGAAGIFELL